MLVNAESPTTFFISRDESYVFSSEGLAIRFGDTTIVAPNLPSTPSH